MNLVVISPDREDARELPALREMFAAGLNRYHLRKPEWLISQVREFLDELSPDECKRVVLHQHHVLADEFPVGGVHFRDVAEQHDLARRASRSDRLQSCACHSLADLKSLLGQRESVLLSPIFSSISKRGLQGAFEFRELKALLDGRTPLEKRTEVIALGGVQERTAPVARDLGFDGVAALGAIWMSPDPVDAFVSLQQSLLEVAKGGAA